MNVSFRRTRLSLNLGSDAAECWASPSKNIISTSADYHVSSPRQAEYKVFCSKLDGLPMSNNSHSNNRNQTLSNTDLTHETDDTNPPLNTKSNEDLNTRAGSLPTVVNAPSPSTGKCRLSICICILLRNSVLPCFQINSFHSQTKTNSTLCKFSHRRYSVDSTSRTGTAHRRGRGTGQ